jgi:radical SAM protein with 4Fe4S-binding SPASM domain
LIGGEPLLRRDILDITDRIHELGYEIVLSTNAVLLQNEHIERFRKYGEKIKISISLDGASSSHHDLIRGSGNFARTVSAIKQLIAANVPTGINSFIHQGNFENLGEIFALAESLGVRSLNVNTLMYVGRGLDEKLKPVSRSMLYRRLFELARSNPHYLQLIEKSNFANKVIAVAGGFKSKYCGIGSNRALYVRSDGTLYPCGDTCISEFQLADLKKQRLAEVWNDSKKLKELRRLNVDTMNPNCAACDVRYYCAGDCRGENYQQTGEFTSPHFKCQEIRESILEIIWMLSECPNFLRVRTNEVVQKARNVSFQE